MFLKFATAICRVCLGPDSTISLFTSGNDEKFKSVSNLELAEDDAMPASLCQNCSERLYAAYEFRQQCASSDLYLRSFVHSMNAKFALEVGNIQQNNQPNAVNVPEPIADMVPEEEYEEPTFKIEVIPDTSDCPESVDQRSTEDDDETNNELIAFNYTYINIDKPQSNESDTKQESVVDISSPFHESPDECEDTQETQNTVQLHPNTTDTSVCHICQKAYSSRANLTRHLLTHSNTKPFHCPVCQSAFTQSGSLKQHMLRHTGEKPHKCTTCGKGFTRKRLLKMHQRIHTGEKPYHCDICNFSFTVKEGLRRHNLRKHFGVTEQIYTCDICNKNLHSKYTFQNHMRLHRRESTKSHGDESSSSHTLVPYDMEEEKLDEQEVEKEESEGIE